MKCKFEEKRNDVEDWCSIHHQFLAGTTCVGCPDYIEEEVAKKIVGRKNV